MTSQGKRPRVDSNANMTGNNLRRAPSSIIGEPDDGGGAELANGFRVYRQSHRCSGWMAGFSVFGVRYTRYFSDAAYGSPEAARTAAELFASENCELHQELMALRRRFEIRKNSRSRIPGVSRYDGDDKRGPFWLAYWDDQEGRRWTRRFSIQRLGESEALISAIKARETGVRTFRERYQHVLASLELLPDKPAKLRTGRG